MRDQTQAEIQFTLMRDARDLGRDKQQERSRSDERQGAGPRCNAAARLSIVSAASEWAIRRKQMTHFTTMRCAWFRGETHSWNGLAPMSGEARRLAAMLRHGSQS